LHSYPDPVPFRIPISFYIYTILPLNYYWSLRHFLVSFDPVDSGAAHGLRDEIALLHSHLLYERQRREVLGARNRRLLGKAAATAI
jgi:hypothetical protein